MSSSWFGLYYPHVRFRDEHWLKITALYWERMYRLYEPDVGISLPCVSLTEEVFGHIGFVRQVRPGGDLRLRAASQFGRLLGNVDLADYQIEPFRSAIPVDEEPILYPRHRSPDETLDSVAEWKMTRTAQENLCREGLAAVVNHRVWMHASLADAYVMLLGSLMAPELGASPVGDDIRGHAAVCRGTRHMLIAALPELDFHIAAQADEREAMLLDMAVSTVLPRDLDAIAADEIVRFRERYAGERARFRDEVSEVLGETAELDKVSDIDVLRDHLRSRFETRIAPALKDLDGALRGQGIDTVLSAMSLQVAAPAAIATGLAALAIHPSAPAALAVGVGGLALGAVRTTLASHRAAAAALAASPVAYLHLIRKDLTPSKMIGDIQAVQ
jgi:hypothetical protein